MSRTLAISVAFRERQRDRTSDQQATHVGDAIAALDIASVAVLDDVVAMDVDVSFHARTGGDGDRNGEEGRDASEHGWREEGDGMYWGESEEAYLCCRWWLGSERNSKTSIRR